MSSTPQFDGNGALLALTSFWSTVSNRFIKPETWAENTCVDSVLEILGTSQIRFTESVLIDRLDRPTASYLVGI